MKRRSLAARGGPPTPPPPGDVTMAVVEREVRPSANASPPRTASVATSTSSDPRDRAAAAIRQLKELRQHLDGIERSIARHESDLDAIFDELGTDRIVTPEGVLLRLGRRTARFAWEA